MATKTSLETLKFPIQEMTKNKKRKQLGKAKGGPPPEHASYSKQVQMHIQEITMTYPGLSCQPSKEYCHPSGAIEQLWQITGSVPLTYQGQNYNLQMEINLPPEYPTQCPMVRISPLPHMHSSPFLLPNGYINTAALPCFKWEDQPNLCQLIKKIVFSIETMPKPRSHSMPNTVTVRGGWTGAQCGTQTASPYMPPLQSLNAQTPTVSSGEPQMSPPFSSPDPCGPTQSLPVHLSRFNAHSRQLNGDANHSVDHQSSPEIMSPEVYPMESFGFVPVECGMGNLHISDSLGPRPPGSPSFQGDARTTGDQHFQGDARTTGGQHFQGDARTTGGQHFQGDARTTGGQHFQGDARTTGGQHFQGDARTTGGQHFQGDARTTRGQYFQGDARTIGDQHFQGDAHTTGGQHFQGDARTTGGQHFQGDAHATGGQYFQGGARTTGGQHFQGDARITGGQHFQGDARTTGGQHFQGDARTTGDQHFQGDAHATGGQHFQGDARTTGGQYFQGDARTTGGQHFQGDARTTGGQHFRGDARTSAGQYFQGDARTSAGQYFQPDARTSAGQHFQGGPRTSAGQYFQGDQHLLPVIPEVKQKESVNLTHQQKGNSPINLPEQSHLEKQNGNFFPSNLPGQSHFEKQKGNFFPSNLSEQSHLGKQKGNLLPSNLPQQSQRQLEVKVTELESKLCDQEVAFHHQLFEKEKLLAQMKSEKLELQQQNLQKDFELQKWKEILWKKEKEMNEKEGDNEALRRAVQQKEFEKQQIEQQLQHGATGVMQSLGGGQGQPHTIEFWKVSRDELQCEDGVVASGAWGIVTKGTFRGKVVAVKRMHENIVSPHNIDLFRREISIMAQVRHPNLVLFIAAVVDGRGSPLVILELLGPSLRRAYEQDLIRCSKLPLLHDVATALNYLHQHQEPIVHRDVSSANVLLEKMDNDRWRAKLSDFGSANLVRAASTLAPGAIVYSAPEALNNTQVQSPSMDVYSYGILTCELATSRFPDTDQLEDMLQQVLQAHQPALHPLIFQCIDRSPNQRPAMTVVIDVLNGLMTEDVHQ